MRYGPRADSKHISISVDLDSVTPLLHFDSGLMEQVLINLLENACKFTPKGGQIRIRGGPFFWERHTRWLVMRRRRRNGDNKVAGAQMLTASIFSTPGRPFLPSIWRSFSKRRYHLPRRPAVSAEVWALLSAGWPLSSIKAISGHRTTVDGPVFSIILPGPPRSGTK